MSALAEMPALGEIVAGRYRLDAVVGAGAMGCVFKAEHVNMGKTVALKMLSMAHPDEDALRRFRLEAKLASQLSHPNIVAITDFDVDHKNRPFIVMDYLRGQSLERVLRDQQVMPVERLVPVITQVCRALHYAHKSGLVHRDIKPSNLMLVERGGERDVPMVVDFGLVDVALDNEETKASAKTVGSPKYMSPEQCKGMKADARSDVYSLGCVMYKCLTGVVPFDGESVRGIFEQHVLDEPKSFSEVDVLNKTPSSVEAVVMKALRKQPGERQQDMEALAQELTHAMTKRSVLDEVNLRDLSRQSSFVNTQQIRKFKAESSPFGMVTLVAVAVVALFLYLYQAFGTRMPQ